MDPHPSVAAEGDVETEPGRRISIPPDKYDDTDMRKVRDLVRDLIKAGFLEISGGKGSHRKFTHLRYPGAVTLSGKPGDDAKPYQEKQVDRAIQEVEQ